MIQAIIYVLHSWKYSPLQTYLAFALSLLLILPYVWYWTRKSGVNHWLAVLALFSGLVTVSVCIYLEYFFPHDYWYWALAEESLKLGILFIYIYLFRIDRTKIVTYGILIALGFAFFENALFVLQPLSESMSSAGLMLINRYMGATNLHILTTGMISLAISQYYSSKQSRIFLILVPVYFVTSVVLHFGFNSLVSGNSVIWYAFAIIWFFSLLFVCLKYSYDISVNHEEFQYSKLSKSIYLYASIGIGVPLVASYFISIV